MLFAFLVPVNYITLVLNMGFLLWKWPLLLGVKLANCSRFWIDLYLKIRSLLRFALKDRSEFVYVNHFKIFTFCICRQVIQTSKSYIFHFFFVRRVDRSSSSWNQIPSKLRHWVRPFIKHFMFANLFLNLFLTTWVSSWVLAVYESFSPKTIFFHIGTISLYW